MNAAKDSKHSFVYWGSNPLYQEVILNLLFHSKWNTRNVGATVNKPAQASELFLKHDKQYILSHIAITKERIKRGKVQNPAAYFIKGLQLDYREIETEFTKAQKGKKLAREQEKIEAAGCAIKEAEQRSSESLVTQKQVASYLSSLSTEELQTIQKECYTKVIAPNKLFNKVYEQKGFEHMVTQKVFSDFVFNLKKNRYRIYTWITIGHFVRGQFLLQVHSIF